MMTPDLNEDSNGNNNNMSSSNATASAQPASTESSSSTSSSPASNDQIEHPVNSLKRKNLDNDHDDVVEAKTKVNGLALACADNKTNNRQSSVNGPVTREKLKQQQQQQAAAATSSKSSGSVLNELIGSSLSSVHSIDYSNSALQLKTRAQKAKALLKTQNDTLALSSSVVTLTPSPSSQQAEQSLLALLPSENSFLAARQKMSKTENSAAKSTNTKASNQKTSQSQPNEESAGGLAKSSSANELCMVGNTQAKELTQYQNDQATENWLNMFKVILNSFFFYFFYSILAVCLRILFSFVRLLPVLKFLF